MTYYTLTHNNLTANDPCLTGHSRVLQGHTGSGPVDMIMQIQIQRKKPTDTEFRQPRPADLDMLDSSKHEYIVGLLAMYSRPHAAIIIECGDGWSYRYSKVEEV